MSRHIVDLPVITVCSSGANTPSNTISGFAGCDALIIYVSSSAGAASTVASAPLAIEVSQLDPSINIAGVGVTRTTGYVALNPVSTSTAAAYYSLTSGRAIIIENPPFRSFRLAHFTSATATEPVGWASAVFIV